MKLTLIILGIIICLISLMVLIGYLLPVKHTVSTKVTLRVPPDQVWDRLIDFKNYPQWRKNLKAVEVKSANEWVEITKDNQTLPLRIIDIKPKDSFSTLIDSKNLPFGGKWIFKLSRSNNYTVVEIAEEGEVYNPVFRFVSKFVIGQTASINQYKVFLEKSFKE